MTDDAVDRLVKEGLVDLDVPPPDGAEVLSQVAEMLSRLVAFPSQECCDAVALWAAHAHGLDAFETTPRLALLSPVPQSGKTRTLEVLDMLTPEPMHAANPSAAALFRQVATKRPTLLMDECDTYLGLRTAEKHEELRGLVNAGHRRGAVAYRCVGEPAKMEVKEFPAFAAVALAGIGDIPPTVLDRSVLIKMRRRAPNERVEPFRERKVRPQGEALCKRLATWVQANLGALAAIEPEMPEGIVDRPADVWEPLIALGDIAGRDWPERARQSAVVINGARAAADPSLGIQLLADIRTVFGGSFERLSSEELVSRLCELEEAPWGDLRGKAMDARGMARRLKPFDVRPQLIRLGEQVRRGYNRTDFYDSWERYLPPLIPPDTVTSVTSETAQVTGSLLVTDAERVTDTTVTENRTATDSRPLTRDVTDVTVVTVPQPSKAQEAGQDCLEVVKAFFPDAEPASPEDLRLLELAHQGRFAEEWNSYPRQGRRCKQ
jgi:hypothetical protein